MLSHNVCPTLLFCYRCSNGRLAMYEIVNGINTILWEGQCSDAPHRWPPRVVESQTNNIWIWYAKAEEWPSILPYTYETSLSIDSFYPC